MRTMSIITPVHLAAAQYLAEAYESLRAQTLPSGWEWEWLVQEDGESGQIARLLPDDDRISIGAAPKAGAATARNIALSRSSGELIKTLDADDMLSDGALTRDIAILDLYPDVGWTTCRTLDLFPDGSTLSFEHHDPPEGRIDIGTIFDYWFSHDFILPVTPGTLCIRRDLIVALGGWTGLPASEDTGLLVAASEHSQGYFIAKTGLLYRKWDGQSTAQYAHMELDERTARHAFIEARARAIREIWSGASE